MHNMGFQYCSKCFLEGSGVIQTVYGDGLDIPGCARLQLEESGHPWACLNGSRSFGLRHVLAWPPL